MLKAQCTFLKSKSIKSKIASKQFAIRNDRRHQSYNKKITNWENEIPMYEDKEAPWRKKTIKEFKKVRKLG